MVLAYGPQGGLVGAELGQAGEDFVPERVVEVAGAVAGDPRQLGQGEDRVAGLAAGGERAAEQTPGPALGGLLEDDRVGRPVQRDAGTQAAQAPEDVGARWTVRRFLKRASPSDSLSPAPAAPGWRRTATSRQARAARAWAGRPSSTGWSP